MFGASITNIFFTVQKCDSAAQDDMLAKLTCRLSQAERESCEGNLTVDECLSALQGMARGNTPGSDGFSDGILPCILAISWR